MSYHGPKVKLARRFGVAWTTKAARILERRPNPPGQHGQNRRYTRDSVYKQQLVQKQLLRSQYNIREGQMRRYYQKALRSRGNYGKRLLQLLEMRLDALVLRAGFAQTIYAARQYVSHGHVLVNNRKVNFPSYEVHPGDEIQIREKSRQSLKTQVAQPPTALPDYLQNSGEDFRVKLERLPVAAEIPVICDLKQVIEFYSR